MAKKSYVGTLLAANPLNPRDNLNHSVILIVTHTDEHCLGLQINRPMSDLSIADVSDQVGLYVPCQDSVYAGGNMQPNRIHMLHSNDWAGLTTVRITEDISLTNDISVLAALSRNEGPEYFRACAGFWSWDTDQLTAQIRGKGNNIKHRWESVPATMSTVFECGDYTDHWHKVIEEAARQQVSTWF